MNFKAYKLIFLTKLLLLTLILMPGLLAAEESGAIKGVVNYCEQGGREGMRVYVPGRQYMLFLGEDGRFQFDGMPAGEYELHYALGGKVLNRNKKIKVHAGATTDIGVIAFCDKLPVETQQGASSASCAERTDDAACQDQDGDGVVAALDCDDSNSSIFPGAIERCDGIDNNCDGKIDNNLTITQEHGVYTCESGKKRLMSCQKGFGNCDNNADNGCEADLMNDMENCGACGNECPANEICSLGSC